MYRIYLAKDKRILSATFAEFGEDGEIVETLPEGKITDYKYINNEYQYNPLENTENTVIPVSKIDEIEAQTTYTAMMTDTLLK